MRSRGTTLLEMLAAIVLAGLVFSLAYQILLPAGRVWALNQAQANLEETSLVAETRLAREMQRSNRSSLTVTIPADPPAPPNSTLQAVSFTAAGDQSHDSYNLASGQPIWQYFVIYYIPAGSTTLYRKCWPDHTLGPGQQNPKVGTHWGQVPYAFPNSNPIPLAVMDLQFICACVAPNGHEQILAQNVTSFVVAAAGPLSATIDFGLQAISPTGQTVQTERATQIEFRM